MIENGVWILAMVLEIGKYDIIIKPYATYPDPEFGYYECILDKDRISKEQRVPMACMRESET